MESTFLIYCSLAFTSNSKPLFSYRIEDFFYYIQRIVHKYPSGALGALVTAPTVMISASSECRGGYFQSEVDLRLAGSAGQVYIGKCANRKHPANVDILIEPGSMLEIYARQPEVSPAASIQILLEGKKIPV